MNKIYKAISMLKSNVITAGQTLFIDEALASSAIPSFLDDPESI
jgi:hypothetical protein